MLLDTADKGREKAIESYYSIKKRLRGNDDDKSEMLLTTYVKERLTKFYSKLHSRFPGQFNQGGLSFLHLIVMYDFWLKNKIALQFENLHPIIIFATHLCSACSCKVGLWVL